ncbi:rRNA maturation RNase YbeY [Candidatus Berkelbacteria bacterium]|nr:rRNA maturation RNase YbeY [Candidatus Berkelbacteria bacterium]
MIKLELDLIENLPVPIKRHLIEQKIREVLATHAQFLTEVTLELVIVDDREMQILNHQHRGIQAPTDVLSLPMAMDVERGTVVPNHTQAPLCLGTILISLETVRRQATRFGQKLEELFLELVEHGVRHLVGHDHDDEGRWR